MIKELSYFYTKKKSIFKLNMNAITSKLFVFFEKKKAQSPFPVTRNIIIIRRIRRVTRHEARFFEWKSGYVNQKMGKIINEHELRARKNVTSTLEFV